MALCRKNTSAPASASPAEAAGPASTSAPVAETQEAASSTVAASDEAVASEANPSSVSERRSPEPEISEDGNSSSVEIDGADDEVTSTSEAIKEVAT